MYVIYLKRKKVIIYKFLYIIFLFFNLLNFFIFIISLIIRCKLSFNFSTFCTNPSKHRTFMSYHLLKIFSVCYLSTVNTIISHLFKRKKTNKRYSFYFHRILILKFFLIIPMHKPL